MSYKETEEYAVAYKSGDMKILCNDIEVNSIYPLDKRIRTIISTTGKIYKRKIIIVEDWVEYELPE